MKKSNISIIFVLIFFLFFLQGVQATALNFRINSSLNSVDSGAYFITKTSNSYSDGFDGFDSIVISPPSNYSSLYSTVSANNLMIDAWSYATSSRTINLTYSVDSAQTGNLNLTWSHNNPEYNIVLNDYGYDINRQSLNSSTNLYSTTYYTINGFNGNPRYLSLIITQYSSVINITPTRNNINVTSNINLTTVVTSSEGISSVWANVTYPNSTSIRYDLATTYYPNYYFNSEVLTLPGEYLVTYYANNSGASSNYSDWFEVYRKYLWNVSFANGTGSATSNINLSFYRPNTSTLLDGLTNSTTNGLASFNVNERFYDLVSTFPNEDSVLIRNINMSNKSLYWNLQNISGAGLNLAMFKTSSSANYSRGLASNSTDFANNSVQVSIGYLGYTPSNDNRMKILKCSNWSYSLGSCSDGWSVLTTSVSGQVAVANSTGFSAYLLAETTCGDGLCDSGETYDGCRAIISGSTDCYVAPGVTVVSGGGGGGGGGLTSTDINKIEEIVKSFLNVGGIKLETASIYKEVFAGEETTVRIQLQNTLNAPKVISLSVDGALIGLISFENSQVSLKAGEEKSVMMKIIIPKTTNPGNYEGDLILISGSEQGKIPVAIRVLSPEGKLIDVRVQPLLPTVAPGNILKVQTDITNTGKAASVNGTLDLQILNLETGEIVLRQQEPFNVETSLSLISEIEIPADFITGKYMLKAVASYLDLDKNEVQISSIAYEEINYSLLERKILFVPVWIWLIILLVAAAIFVIYYALWKIAENKRRYRVKVNLATLPQAGKNSEFVGKIAETGIRSFIDLNKLQTHTLIAGSTGSGKTVVAQDLVEAALLHNKSVVVFDPTAQWTGFLKKCEDSAMLKRYKYFDMNTNSATGFKGTLKTVTDPYEIIDLPKYTAQQGAITVFDVSHLTPKEIDLFVASSIEQVFKSNPQEARELKSLLVYDEVHRLLPKFGGSGEGFLQLERGAREFRKWGIGLVLISQVLSDFVGEVKANIGTEIQMGTRYEGDLERINMKYGEDVLKSVVKEAIGTGMVVNAEYNNGKPYFVSFRPLLHNTQRLSDADLKKYTEYFEKIENIEDQISQLDKHKVDVIDLQLETKLARNKISVGQFQLAEMYVEPIIKKLEETWKKIGKKPVEKKKQKFTKSDIEFGVKKAKAERQKFIKKEIVVNK